ncbi:YVTN beta-propeller repeat-containing protein (plasmid) [Alkalihalophilus pseudofirmus OF4]|uniref:YVTN beta-propeller repeat-containing protein n=2 Tax=Bacillaceae TaxID=186817 RepID=D3G141_ALKPO|nr:MULTISPECIES: YncE family protein [Bacillaceae]ADC52067.1 YVTN beta-propeller repeat-containing protein [Alkalihalophilus pseudofirmus OF4]MDX5476152.1 YncE family protein [Bacillaceae bacterium]GAE35563.1 40-residue YVTN family beta-propeller repeat protein [Halalkalibacter akibai JCM 9157]
MNRKICFILMILTISLLLAACGQNAESVVNNEENANAENKLNDGMEETEKQVDVGEADFEEEYIVVVGNEKDGTMSVIYYPEGRQELVYLDGEAHNLEVNVESQLIWVTINPPHEDNEDEKHSHNHEDDGNEEQDKVKQEMIVAYDINTLEKVEEHQVGSHPAHVTTTENGEIVVVTNSGDNSVTVINRKTDEVVNVEVGEYPHGVRISPDQQNAYIANMQSADVSIIDLQLNEEVNRVHVGEGAVQTGFSHDGKYAFVGLHVDNQLAVINTSTQEVIKHIDVGVGPVQMFASYDNQYVVVANQGSEENPSDTISIIGLDTLEVEKEVPLGKGAHGIVISKDSQYAFVTNMFEDTVSVVDLKTLEEVKRLDVGEYPNGISIN